MDLVTGVSNVYRVVRTISEILTAVRTLFVYVHHALFFFLLV